MLTSRPVRVPPPRILKGWFIIDLMSTLPIDTIVEAAAGGGAEGLRVIRLLRLLKLFRIVRASRVFARWADRIEHYISISHSMRTLLWWCFLLVTVVHWFCCVWGLTAQLQGSQRTPELMAAVAADEECSASGACLPTDTKHTNTNCVNACLTACELRILQEMKGWSAQLAFNQENWVCRAEAAGTVLSPYAEGASTASRVYRYMSIAPIFGQVESTNLTEYCVAYVLAFLWLMMQNAFIGILCGTIADGDRHAKEYKQRMDELNYFLRDMNAPSEVAVRAREHCRSTRGLFKKFEYVKLFQIMSPMLRGDLAQLMSLRTLENVWYFRSCEADMLRSLSEKLRPFGFARSERIYYEPRINIVTKGAAARGGKILTLDCYWGDDMIVTSEQLKDTRYASALTYLELTTISRSDLEDCLVHFPKSERVIRVTALKMAMQRAGQIISHHLQTRVKAKQLSGVLARFTPGNAMFSAHAKHSNNNEGMLKEMMTLINGGKKLRVFDQGMGKIVDENETVIDDDYIREWQKAHQRSTEAHLLKIQEDIAQVHLEQTKQMERERASIESEREAMAAEREMYKKLLDGFQGGGGGGGGGMGGNNKRPPFIKQQQEDSFTRSRDSISPTGTETPPRERARNAARDAKKIYGDPKEVAGSTKGAKAIAELLVKKDDVRDIVREASRSPDANLKDVIPGGSARWGPNDVVKEKDGVLMEKRYRRKKKEGGARSASPPPARPQPGGNSRPSTPAASAPADQGREKDLDA